MPIRRRLATRLNTPGLQDHVVVAAAGNGGSDGIGDNNEAIPFFPGNFEHDNLLAVAATDHNDQLATFSNYGSTLVDLGAPGVSIYSTMPNNQYDTLSGTSMATPHVTGVVALLQSEHPGLALRTNPRSDLRHGRPPFPRSTPSRQPVAD